MGLCRFCSPRKHNRPNNSLTLSLSLSLSLVALSVAALFFSQASPAFATSSFQELKETVGATSSEHASQVLADAQENVTAVANTLVEDTTQLFDVSGIETIPGDTTNALDSTQRSSENPATTNLDTPIGAETLAHVASKTASPANDAIVVDGDTVTIQGDCTTTEIFTVMRKSGGAGKNATNLHFSNSITITTEQTSAFNSPFANTNLRNITAEENASVSFAPKTGSDAPTLKSMFSKCSDLTNIDGLSVWNVLNVTGDQCMYSMFLECFQLSTLDALANWDVSQVRGSQCMQSMFYKCYNLSSLDALANWDVSEVAGEGCMAKMFEACSGLISLDGIASWNVAKAIASTDGIALMFDICKNLSSLTVNPNDGFQLDSSMKIPSTFETGGNYWWPVKGADKGIATSALYDASKNTDTYGTRWVRGEENINPYISGVIPEVTWTTIAKPYTGLNQTIGPDKVEVDGTELKAGVDYTVLYTKNTTQENAEVASPVVRDKGTYTEELYLQGKYVAQKDPSYKQTVYVTEPNTVALTFNAAGGTFASTGDSLLGLVNQTAGQAIASVEEPTRAGYEFSGWKDASGSTVTFPLTVPATDATYSATWIAIDYAVILDAGPGTSWGTTPSLTISATATPTAPVNYPKGKSEPVKEGYTFSGWKSGSDTLVIGTTTFDEATGKTYTATWTAEPGPGPTPPGPTPGPTPEPTPSPDINPVTDTTLLPVTGDTTVNITNVLSLACMTAAVLFTAFALKKKRA